MSHKTKTYRAYWIGRDRWGLLNQEDDITVDTRPFYECRTDELEPDSYAVERWEWGKVAEAWKTRDGAKLRDHLTQLSKLMDAEPVDMTTRNLLELAIWCDSHDLDLMVRTF